MDQAANQSDIRVCAGCGRLIPADAPECAYCGARSEKVEEALREATLQERFARAIFKRSSPFTYLFIGINLGVFILMWLAGGMGAMSANPEVIVGFGAKENDLINNQQQYWRLVTSIFIHIGFLHLFFNNYALYIIGQQIELLYGSSRFVLLYLLTGIAGSTASYLYNTQTAAGASGAIFGLFGVMAIFAFRYRKEIPQGMQSSIKRQVIPLIVINLIITFSIPLIDKSAHIGGLVAGVILGLIIPYKRPQERRTAALWRVLLVVCMLVIFGSLGAAYSAYSGPPLRLDNLAVTPGIPTYHRRMLRADELFRDSAKSFRRILSEKNENADVASLIGKLNEGIQAANDAPEQDRQTASFRNQLLRLLEREKALLEEYAGSKQKDWNELTREQRAIEVSYSQFNSEFYQWLGDDLKKRGYPIEITEEPADDQ